MKQVEVTILGQGYILGCPDGGEARLGAAVAAVDREMCAIRDAGKIKARDRIAVLAALNLAYQLAERPPAAGAGSGRHQPLWQPQRQQPVPRDRGCLPVGFACDCFTPVEGQELD